MYRRAVMNAAGLEEKEQEDTLGFIFIKDRSFFILYIEDDKGYRKNSPTYFK